MGFSVFESGKERQKRSMQWWQIWKNFLLKLFLYIYIRCVFVAPKPLLLDNKLMSVFFLPSFLFFFCLFVLFLMIKGRHNMIKVLCIHWKMLNCEEKTNQHIYVHIYIYIYIYRESVSRFSRGTVLNTLK